MSTQALDAITRIDLGLATDTDRALADLFDRHASDDWYRRELRLDSYAAGACLICGKPGQAPECDGCVIGHDAAMQRAEDQ